MRLHEYQSKQFFAKYGIPIPKGDVATTPEDASAITKDLASLVMVKSQVIVGSRGKAGGILIAHNFQEAELIARKLLSLKIRETPVRKVLVEQAVEISREIYLSITIDRSSSQLVMMSSSEGGVDIEEVTKTNPGSIKAIHIKPYIGLRAYQTIGLAKSIGLDSSLYSDFNGIARSIYQILLDTDASLVEINPLVITSEGKLMAVDGKMVLDDNGLFRHPNLIEMRGIDEETPIERKAREAGLSYVALDGEIGCMVNGAGLAMATMDIIKHFGCSPANFLDIGGGAQAEKVARALGLILEDPKVKVVLINIFGGITRCDEVAYGVLKAIREINPRIPMVARLVGTNDKEGREILADSRCNTITATTLVEAAQKAVEAACWEEGVQ